MLQTLARRGAIAEDAGVETIHHVLIVGTGSIGERHVRCFLKTHRATVSIAETATPVRERVAASYPIDAAFPYLDAAFDSGRAFDIALIATPAPLHVPMARRAIEAGCHLLIEKPLSTGFDGIAALEQEVAAAGRTAAVAYVYRAHPALRELKTALDGGSFGEPRQVYAIAGQSFATSRPAYRDIYYADRMAGGGALQDALTHPLNAVQWLIGPADRLLADASHQVLDGVDVEDTVHVISRHGGVLANFCLNQYQAPNESSITVVCTNGTLRFEMAPPRFRSMVEPFGTWTDWDAPVAERDDMYVAQAETFLDAVEGTATVPCTIGEAADTLATVLAATDGVAAETWLEPRRHGGIR